VLFFEQGFNCPAPIATVGLVCNYSRKAERHLVERPRLLLFIPLSAPEACPKDDHQLVLYQPRNTTETGSEKKRERAEWPPSELGEEFSHTFTGQESLGLSTDDMLLIAGSKGICAKGQYGNVPQAIKKNHPLSHGVNEHNCLVNAVKYCVAHPLITAGGMQKFFSSGVYWTVIISRMFGVCGRPECSHL